MMRFVASSILLAAVASCSVIASSSIDAGIGQPCKADDECQGDGATCDANRCVTPCKVDEDCPTGSRCGAGVCDVTLKVAFVYDGSPNVSGFARAHDEGRLAAKAALPWVDFNLVAQDIAAGDESTAIKGLIDDGADAIFVTTSRFSGVAEELAKTNAQKPVRFFTFGIPVWDGSNFAGYVPRYHQAWFLSGVAMASFAKAQAAGAGTKFGFVGALPIPEVITQLNAFTLGARSVDPTATVDVVWVGGFVPDPGIVEKAVDYLVDDGATILVNRIGARQKDLLKKVGELRTAGKTDLYATVLDNADACGTESFCLGGPSWNWGPLYTRISQELQRGTFDPNAVIRDGIQSEPSQSVFNLTLASQPQFSGPLRDVLATKIRALSEGGDNTFSPALAGGEVCATKASQRSQGPCVDGRVEDAELDGMCWLVKGVVQRRDPNKDFDDQTNPLVDATTPENTLWPPTSFGATPVPLSCG